uniref:anti-sigma factor domain-containing protein n=1 Tax=Calditerricola satsumensis TaxID=373054 RepID=UPI0006D1F38D|nr:anti-sigma factor domain-containing protein [Calditerricola satsumensis]
MKRGIVLQVNASDVVVLTPDGQFCRLRRDPNRAYVVGEEIRFFPDKPRHRVKPAGALWLAAMAACLALVVVGGLLWMTAQPVMAYVTLDINPSVEMSIDERYRVIDLAGLNPDGERLVAELPHWKDRDLAAVTAEVLHQARRWVFNRGAGRDRHDDRGRGQGESPTRAGDHPYRGTQSGSGGRPHGGDGARAGGDAGATGRSAGQEGVHRAIPFGARARTKADGAERAWRNRDASPARGRRPN